MKMTSMKKALAVILAASSLVSALPVYAAEIDENTTVNMAMGTMSDIPMVAASTAAILKAQGYQEGAYVQWGAVDGADGYNVYCDGVQIDSMLIRQYSGYFRADAVGITAGEHTLKIVPTKSGAEMESAAASTTVTSIAHERDGFAFNKGKALGAYNADGTLKSGAVVVYITNENKDSVKATIGGASVTGFQEILNACQDSTTPVVFRCIGNINDPSVLDKGDLLIDGITCGLTIQGIGSDTTFNGFGIRVKNSSDVEIGNIGLMNCDSEEGDAVGLQQSNDHVWVHNCDFFYGLPGSDADQVKGDGALDTKKSQYVTHSYNHFWDSGKTHLNGNGDTTLNYITYHHNWYDHSDSRHPLVRVSSAVHCYNNYYDGVAKYGMIARKACSIFAEANYFKDTNNPILISQQGTDIADGDPISSEPGGMIKSFGNIYDNTESPITHTASATDFDCYEASSATEQVPSSYKTVNGGTSYSNFDTSSDMYAYTADAAADVPAIVQQYAGRLEGGDFDWDFSDPSEDRNYTLIDGLSAALKSYDDSIVAIGSGFASGNDVPIVTTTTTASTTKGNNTTTTTKKTDTPVVSGGYVHDFTANGTSSSFYTITGNLSTSKGTVNYDGKTLTQCLKLESATSITFNAASSGVLTLVLAEANTNVKVDGQKYASDASGIVTVEVGAGAHTITKGDTANLFYMVFSGEGGPVVTTASSTTGSNNQTSATTTKQTAQSTVTSGNIVTGDLKVKSVGGWNEMMYLVVEGVADADVTSVSYSGPVSGTLAGEDFEFLVRDVDGGARVDVTGLTSGMYSITMETTKGNVTVTDVAVGAQDRSGYAHFGFSEGVGAYKDDGTLKENAIVLYVTDGNKDTVSVTSKDGTTVKGIGNILNSAGKDAGTGATAKGGIPNTNSGIIKKLAEDGTPLVVRIIGNVTAPEGVTEFDSVNYGGSVGDNGYMARMQSGKDVTIEGIGTDATINGWGIHFIAESATTAQGFGKSFEVRNIAFRNVPEDCLGMEGVQETELTAPVERCWIHNCEFYAPKIANPAESDKDGGDGACDFKRGMYFTNSYCYYEGYHKTNLVGSSDSSLQYHLTYHHNYWKSCESRGPLARQADIHMYNNVFDGQTSYCMNPRANAYIFSEYNLFKDSKDPMEIKLGAIKSYNDVFENCRGNMQGTIVSSKDEVVSCNNLYKSFELDASLCYVASNDYILNTDVSSLASAFEKDGGCMDEMAISGNVVVTPGSSTTESTTTTTTTTTKGQGTTASTTTTTTTTSGNSSGLVVVSGDVDLDGGISLIDVVYLNKYLAKNITFNAQQEANADCVSDGEITPNDTTALLQYIIEQIPSLPIQA